MVKRSRVLSYYAEPGRMSSAGNQKSSFKDLPEDVDALARMIQGLGIYEHTAEDFYAFAIPEERKRETQLRSAEQKLAQLHALDPQPLSVARPLDKRLVGICHHFALLLVAMLRAKHTPARARYGFGSYFNPPYFEEHIVCEYWNAREARWALADPLFDKVWRRKLKIKHDILDVPRDRFVVAGDAWRQCRAGKADPDTFGIYHDKLYGLWYIAGELIRDVAALNKMEMLPWDVWGAIPSPNEQLDPDLLPFFDRLAKLSHDPDRSFDELRALYESDDRLHVPGTVFNALLQRRESV